MVLRCNRGRRGFTLIELLVVIAIIALLVAILLPALSKARIVARLTKSMSNVRQIGNGIFTYRSDFKEWLPFLIVSSGANGTGTIGWATWTYGGKNCDARWTAYAAGVFDQAAGNRPLNQYIYPELAFEVPVTNANRYVYQTEVTHSPGDKASFQFLDPYPTPDYTKSSYDDVGTSYHNNMKWWDRMLAYVAVHSPQGSGESTFNFWMRVMKEGHKRMSNATDFNAAKFVFIHDQTGDVVANDPLSRNWIGEFGDRNKSVMQFLDGHVNYITMVPGQTSGPDYQFYFPLPGE